LGGKGTQIPLPKNNNHNVIHHKLLLYGSNATREQQKAKRTLGASPEPRTTAMVKVPGSVIANVNNKK
jgi:hypothetical protein